ncbi:MAG: hypothetical protein P1U74_02460 [Legionellaceae bacterium]|nr:hypothetical protein [Legionellaceae bacterium]
MKVIRLFLTVFFMLVVCLGVGHAEKDNLSYSRDFWSPKYHDKQLSYCLLYDKKKCGNDVANMYCKKMGYDRSSKSIIANNVGYTIFLDGCRECKHTCKGWNCNGFKLIRCVNDISHNPVKSYYFRSKTFVYPRYKKYRVAWCYENDQQCGRRAADSFCKRMGYMKEQSYVIDKEVNATKSLGDSKLCFGDECLAFSRITCYR